MRKSFLVFPLLLSLWGAPLYAVQSNLNLPLLKKDTQIFESIVSEVLKQNFKNPFAIAAEPQAAFLHGYGIVVTFQLRINRGKIRWPFGEIDAPAQSSRTKQEQVRTVKETMIQCLADFGNSIKQINAHDRISIGAQIEDRNELDPTLSRTIVVLTVEKEDLDLYDMRKISLEEFKNRVTIVEY